MNEYPIIYLNSNDGSGFLAFGDGPIFVKEEGASIQAIQDFIDAHSGEYLFGHLGYDLKNDFYALTSANTDQLNFPDTFLWVPKYVIKIVKDHFEFLQGEKNVESFDFLNHFLKEPKDQAFQQSNYTFKARISKEEYIGKVVKLKNHIQQGDIYEVNFCQEFYAEDVEINFPMDTYYRLNDLTHAPFSSYYQFGNYAAFCGSPERFLKKEGPKLISQPIKGTAPRGATLEADEKLKNALQNDPKERAENTMIVDLVRNDLSRVAEKDSVKVEEYCAIYSFDTVHQMISTISCEVKPEVTFTDILRATFPMGSMTGAPKLRAMELIEENESFKRGLYSGSIGYIAPNGDFDFNVVIRSLLYNTENRYLSCSVGGAITIQSDPEKEYEECMVKVKRILDGMNG
jgi:para-aminobenzoate synthetase component 1